MKFSSFFLLVIAIVASFTACKNDSKKDEPAVSEVTAEGDSIATTLRRAVRSSLRIIAHSDVAIEKTKIPGLKEVAGELKTKEQNALKTFLEMAQSNNLKVADSLSRKQSQRIASIKIDNDKDDQRLLLRLAGDLRSQVKGLEYLSTVGDAETKERASELKTELQPLLQSLLELRQDILDDKSTATE